jgi:diadenosine tetraphosphate (Ap4A) HIT family hydrolase
MLPEPFNGTEEYRGAFTQGLVELLQHDQLGTYILVLANATYDAEIHRKLKQRLEVRFEELAALLTQYLKDGRTLDHTSDDLLVFLKLLTLGFDQLQMSKFRHAGPWQIQYNQLRSFRPARMSNEAITELFKPFDEQDFHFNKHFLEKEIMWRGSLHDRDCSLFYNKFPFAPLHGLLVVEPKRNRPQLLDQDTHGYLWQLAEQMGNKMPGVGFGYNARGAFASVNHQHFQMYVRDKGIYPIEQSLWRHNGGARDYPLPCQSFRTMNQAWEALRELHESNLAYSLLYRPGVLYLTPRSKQGTYEHMDWTGGFAWAEIAGSITTFRGCDFMQLDEQQITNEMKKMAVCPENQ